MDKVAVAILNYNGLEHLKTFLPSVAAYSLPHPIYIIDNASTDESRKWVENTYPLVRWIQLEENYGFTGGYNRGLQQIEAEIFILLNSDVEVTPNWISPFLAIMQDKEVAACQPKILAYKQKDTFEYAGAAGGMLDRLGYPYCKGRIFDTLEKDLGQYDEPTPIFWASGACMVVRASDYREAGGLPEDYFAHMEEIDLCWRFHLMGKKVMSCPASTVFHLGGGTLQQYNPRKTYLNFRNNLSTLYKYSAAGRLFWILPIRFFLDILAAIHYLIKGQGQHTLAILKGIFHFYKKILRGRLSRKFIKRAHYPVPLFSSSILFSYHLAGKRTYSQLSNTK